MLDVRVRVSFDHLFDREAGRPETAFYLLRREEDEVRRHALPPPLVQVRRVVRYGVLLGERETLRKEAQQVELPVQPRLLDTGAE